MSVVVEETTAPQSPVVDEEVRDVLREAKGLVAQGWCQHHAHLGDKFCVLGALITASVGGEWRAVTRARHAVRQHIPATVTIPEWNDAPGRTQAEVVALFDKALGA
jgi:hypothetical protein